jgi:hypothetical protein
MIAAAMAIGITRAIDSFPWAASAAVAFKAVSPGRGRPPDSAMIRANMTE